MALSSELVLGFLALTTCGLALSPPLPLQTVTAFQQEDYQKAPAQLLQAFGLSEPGIRRWHSEPPQYMLDLYDQVADFNGLTRLPGPYGAKVIRAFSERDTSSGSNFVFSISGLEESEQVLEAELHVYHSRLHKAHRRLLDDNIYTLEVYAEKEGDRRVLMKQPVAAHSSGWRVFQVGSWVMKVASATERGEDERQVALQVIARTLEGRPLPIAFHHGLRGARRPVLILFDSYLPSNDSTELSHAINTVMQKKSNTFQTASANRLRRSVEDPTTTTATPTVIPSGCERRDMMVDFSTIGWSSWIVYPTSYNAFQCLGECQYPLGQNLNPTNHATVQSIINHSGDFPEVQRPCCVPSTYGNLSLLYYDAEENVVLKQYDQMVAIECGCH